MKKVLFLISTLNTGGAQRIISNIIMAFPEDWKIDILLNDSQNISYPYKGNIIDLQMKPEKNKEKVLYQIKVFWRRFHKLKALKRHGGYDACISALDSANVVNVLTGQRYCRTILSVHGFHPDGWVDKRIEPLVNRLMRYSYRRGSRVVAVSQGLYQEMTDKFRVPKEKLSIIYNGYDIEKIVAEKNLSPEHPLPFGQSEEVIVACGRLEKVKGQWHMIKAFSEVVKVRPNAKLVILGEGSLRTELEQLIVHFHLEKSVFLLGFVNNPYAYMNAAKVYLMTSLSEGLPNGIIEALSCSLPCISSDCISGPREILAPGTCRDTSRDKLEYGKYGVLCPDFKEDTLWDDRIISPKEKLLSDGMIELLSNEQLRKEYADKAYKRALDFDIANVIGKWLDLCEEKVG